MISRVQNEAEVTALLIAPNRQLAQMLLDTLPQTRAFQILADLKSYPPQQTLEMRVRQLKPNVVLLDLATDPGQAVELVRAASSMTPPVMVVGLHTHNDSQAILQSLRAGASEFLYAPFEPAILKEAVARLRRLVQPEPALPTEAGRTIAFTSSKPGSGASTIATQTAFALQKITGKRVLLADCDLTGGTIGFYLKLTHSYSILDALQHAEHLDATLWSSLTVNCGGVDILPSPAVPFADPVDPARLRMLADHARFMYDWVILDLPTIFSRTSLMAVSESDCAFMVSTSELPSLHLTRKALMLVSQLGFPKDRFKVLVNRMDRRQEMTSADIEKLFGCSVHASLPNDYFALHRVVTLGQPLGAEGELGKAIENVAQRLKADAKKDIRPALAMA